MNEQSSITGSGSVDIRTEGHTQIDGAVIANIDEEGNDGGNLSLDTGTLAYSDIEDHDQEKSTYLNVGFTMGDDNSTNQSESGTNYTASGHYNNHDKEQINRATVGEGTIVVRDNTEQDTSDLNRDTDLAQEVTKDDSQNTNLYASTTAADSLTNLAENPSEQLNQWKDNVASVGSADAWDQVGENASDALEDTYNAGAAVATDKDLGVGNFWVSLDSTHKMTQLKNDLTRTAEGQALLARLTSDDPDQRLAAEAELGHMAQEKFGIDPSDIHFYQGSETTSESLADTALSDVKGATVTEEGHSEYGNILVNVDNATDGKDMTNTVGHEVYETVTLQTGGENDASQEAIANLVGGQLANRIDQATGGELANVGTGDLAGSNTVRQGTQHANAVGNAQVDYRQLQSKEMQAIKKMAPLMAEKEGITEEAAEKRMAEELLSHLDASWSSNFEAQGRESDETALDYLAGALVEQGSAYAEYSDSDVPESPDATPKTYTKEEVKQSLIAYKDERTSEYNDRTREGEGLTSQYSEQWQFYDKNLAADKSLSDYGDTALGAFAGFMDTGGGIVYGLVSDPIGTAQNASLGMQQMLNEPEGTVSSIFEQREEGQINAALDNLQGDYFSGARTGMSTDLGFALDMGLLPVGRVGGLKNVKAVDAGNAVELANSWQTRFPYIGQDKMKPIALSQGKMLVQVVLEADASPSSSYFTTPSAIKRATLPDGTVDANVLNQGLQIDGSKYTNFRANLQYFQVNEPIPHGEAAFGRATANQHLNPGGHNALPQIFLKEDFLKNMNPVDITGGQGIKSYPMINTETPSYLFERLPKE